MMCCPCWAGTLPASWSNMVSLDMLDLAQNNLTGVFFRCLNGSLICLKDIAAALLLLLVSWRD
jgi:hypothetical protein